MASRFDLRGVVSPLATPLTSDADVDTFSLKRLIEFQIAAGVNGFWVLGSTGEFECLTDQQRRVVIDTTIETVAGRVPVIVGTIDVGTERSIEQGRHAKAAGADGIFTTPPIYMPAAQAEIRVHCTRLREAVDLPLVLYDARYATRTPIEIETLQSLAGSGAIQGLKDSSDDWASLRQLVAATQGLKDFAIVTGNDCMMDAALLFGARGCIASNANVVPELYAGIYTAAQAGDWAQAAVLQNRAAAVARYALCGSSEGTFISRFFIGFKCALKARGLIETATIGAPFLQATAADELAVRTLLQSEGIELPSPRMPMS